MLCHYMSKVENIRYDYEDWHEVGDCRQLYKEGKKSSYRELNESNHFSKCSLPTGASNFPTDDVSDEGTELGSEAPLYPLTGLGGTTKSCCNLNEQSL